MCTEGEVISNSGDYSDEDKEEKLSHLGLHGVSIKDLVLTMVYTPGSSIHNYSHVPLCEDGENIEVQNHIFT